MCKISNEIKLCSCSSETDFSQISNYWEIMRKDKNSFRIGETVFNENELNIEEVEIENLLEKLNSKNLFDFDYKPENGDKLEIHFSISEKYSDYSFLYKSEKWEINSSILEWMEEFNSQSLSYVTKHKGEILKPFQ